jgi:hypothetical protein
LFPCVFDPNPSLHPGRVNVRSCIVWYDPCLLIGWVGSEAFSESDQVFLIFDHILSKKNHRSYLIHRFLLVKNYGSYLAVVLLGQTRSGFLGGLDRMTMIRSILTFSPLAPVSEYDQEYEPRHRRSFSRKEKGHDQGNTCFFFKRAKHAPETPKAPGKQMSAVYFRTPSAREKTKIHRTKHKQHESKCKILKESRFRNRFKFYTRK